MQLQALLSWALAKVDHADGAGSPAVRFEAMTT